MTDIESVGLMDNDLADPAKRFLTAAFTVLEGQRLAPPPSFHPYIRVGRDYFGSDLMPLPEFIELEKVIGQAHHRFSEDTSLGERDFASGYIFSFLEAWIARCTISGEPFASEGRAAYESIKDLNQAIHADRWEIACCREISHLTTTDGAPLDIAGIRVIPLTALPHNHRRNASEVIEGVIAGAGSSYGRESPWSYAPPESIVVARETVSDPFESVKVLEGRIERFLLLTRLLYAGTGSSIYEVQGETALVRRFSPTLVRFRGDSTVLSTTRMIRRTVRLRPADDERIEGLWNQLTIAEKERPGFVLTSFGMAVHKFQLSYHAHDWWEQVVDLATALEAALSGKDKTDVLLRIKTRASALLACDRDPASAIFRDVDLLYDLRSKLVHGGEISERELAKKIRGISTVPQNVGFGIARGHLVDRLRDLVRRSLLARVCLAADSENDPTWPLGEDSGIDLKLADDEIRRIWRDRWRNRLADVGAADAADPPRAAADFLSRSND